MKTEKITNNTTELVFILDKSGSMHGLEADTIGGFNSMIDEQKKIEGEALVTTVLFSNRSEMIHDRVSLSKIAPMTANDYQVGGCTALLDAIGEQIEHIESIHKYAREEDVPGKTMFIITTDGMENASVKFNGRQIKKMIEQKKEDGWEFLFLAANIDAAETAETMGISRECAVQYEATSEGSRAMYENVCGAVAKFRKNNR